MSGIIGVPTSQIGRYSEFWESLNQLERPAGTIVRVGKGGSVALNRNGLTSIMLEQGLDWIFYVDDDQIFQPDTLLRLLADNKPVVSGTYCAKHYPFPPHVYWQNENGDVVPRNVKDESGLLSVGSVGAGALLVRRDVIEKMDCPWWTLGQIHKDKWGDDVDFCRRVRLAGFEIWIDLSVPVGHKLNGTVWPTQKGYRLEIGDTTFEGENNALEDK
jgi:GT2 family glycosyltransferase